MKKIMIFMMYFLFQQGLFSVDPNHSLTLAIVNDDLEAARDAIARLKDSDGIYAISMGLIKACVLNKTDIALALIEAGADLDVTNFQGDTALDIAKKRNYNDLEAKIAPIYQAHKERATERLYQLARAIESEDDVESFKAQLRGK